LLPNTTFYVATHSPLVLSQLKDGEAYLLRRDNDGVVRSKNIDLPNRQFFVDMLEAGFGIDINNLEPDNVMEQNAQQKASEQKLLSLLESLKTQEGAEA
jgi:hypothetical protein